MGVDRATARRRTRNAAGLGPALVLLAACTTGSDGPSRGDEPGPDLTAVERDLGGQIDERVGRQWQQRVRGSRVDCPSGARWTVGEPLRCDVTVPGFPSGYVEITPEDDGTYRWLISNE